MKNIKIITLVFLMGIFVSNVFAEKEKGMLVNNKSTKEIENTFSVKGQVIDKSTGETLAGVNLFIEELNIHVFTDLDGNFSFNNIKNDEITIQTSYISYQSVCIEKLKVKENKEFVIKL